MNFSTMDRERSTADLPVVSFGFKKKLCLQLHWNNVLHIKYNQYNKDIFLTKKWNSFSVQVSIGNNYKVQAPFLKWIRGQKRGLV